MNKKIIAVLLVVVSLVAVYSYNNRNNSYSLTEINQDEFEMNGRKIVFKDKPQNTEELVVANHCLYQITGEYDNLRFLYPNLPEMDRNNSIENYKEGVGRDLIKINDLKLLTETDIKEGIHYGTRFSEAKLFEGMTYAEYIAEKNINDYKIVKVEYYFEYTDKAMERGLQYLPGDVLYYYLLEGDSKGNYIISDISTIRSIELTYVNDDLGFKMEFPKECLDQYFVKEHDNSIGIFSYKVKKNSDFAGRVFSIDRMVGELITEEDLSNHPMPLKIVEQANGYTYILRKPSDVQYPPDNKEIAEEYLFLQSFIDEIIESFEIVGTNRPAANNEGFKVVGSSFFTAEIPEEWSIEVEEDSYMNWCVLDEGTIIGYIEFKPYFTAVENGYGNGNYYIVENEKLLRKAVVTMSIHFEDIESFRKFYESIEIIDGPVTVVDMLTHSQQYLMGGCKSVFGDIERIEYADEKPIKIFINEKNFIEGDYPNGFTIESVSDYPVEYKVDNCRIILLAPPNYITYDSYYMPLVEVFEMTTPYDVMSYNFIISSDDEVLMIIGIYIP